MFVKTRVVVCWSLFSGYAAACWKQLANHPDIELLVICYQPDFDDAVAFSESILDGVNVTLLARGERENYNVIRSYVASFSPDVFLVSGWSNRAYRRLIFDREFVDVPVIMTMDNTLRADLRQWLGKFLLKRIFRRISYLWVPGERAAAAARYWNVESRKIRKGVLAIDASQLEGVLQERLQQNWPRSFLFAGRYHERKGIATLLDAYSQYRLSREEPWDLCFMGMGPLAHLVNGAGIRDLGFVQPDQVRSVWKRSGALVLPSWFEPWGLVIAEAAYSGLPVICTSECGAESEIVRHGFNGLVVPRADVSALKSALERIHDLSDLERFGKRSHELASPYKAENWVDHFCEMLQELRSL